MAEFYLLKTRQVKEQITSPIFMLLFVTIQYPVTVVTDLDSKAYQQNCYVGDTYTLSGFFWCVHVNQTSVRWNPFSNADCVMYNITWLQCFVGYLWHKDCCTAQ